MRIVWVHIEIYDFWLETLVLWHLSTVWDSIEIIGVFFLGETSEKQITFLSHCCLGETAKIFKKSPWDYSLPEEMLVLVVALMRNIWDKVDSWIKRVWKLNCVSWAMNEHPLSTMNFKTNENSMDLEDLMRHIWFYIEISDFWLQTLVLW